MAGYPLSDAIAADAALRGKNGGDLAALLLKTCDFAVLNEIDAEQIDRARKPRQRHRGERFPPRFRKKAPNTGPRRSSSDKGARVPRHRDR
jgi:hypothetical protein